MSREIKFRAWDSHSKQMIYDVLVWTRKDGQTSVILPHGMKSEKAYAVVGGHWKTDDFGNRYSDLNVVIPMQYTGLKDNNGKEVYEGDIIANTYKQAGYEKIRIAKSARKAVEWRHSTNNNGWTIFRGDNYVIIGNIYENPELLP